MPKRRCILRLLPLVGLLALLAASAAAEPAEESGVATERWYEIQRAGQKLGHQLVVWAPSTWESRPTIHDTTTVVETSVRVMMGIRDEFEVFTTIDLERGEDGTLWWMRVIVEESGRVTTTETVWTGEGYDHVSRLEGVERKISVPLDLPVMLDAESFLGSRIREGKVKVGDTFDLRLLDVTARGARTTKLEVVSREDVADHAVRTGEGDPSEIPCFKVVETDPLSKESTTFWLDDDGAFVRLVAEGGIAYRRVAREQAREAPVAAAELKVTTPSTPVLERIMSADRLHLDLHLRGDPDRPLPEFPDSPFSRQVGLRGSDEEGWVAEMVLSKYSVPETTAQLPMDTTGLERHLEETVLMPCRHPRIQEEARRVVGDEKDARKAAYLLARRVFELVKVSPSVAQASALEILDGGEGDCSEHALLFVTLCRAIGIPARQCTGYVSVASQWGSHAWAEIWLGAWVGADPTTGEIGTGARYVFFGYHDDPKSFPGLVSARARGRMRYVITRVVEGDDDYDLTDHEAWHIHDREKGRYVHVLAGIEARGVPNDWVVRMSGPANARVRGPGFRVSVIVTADQGSILDELGLGYADTFADLPARVLNMGFGRGTLYVVHSRRRFLQIRFAADDPDTQEELLARLQEVLAPTFAPTPKAAPPPSEAPPEGAQEEEKEPEPQEGDEE